MTFFLPLVVTVLGAIAFKNVENDKMKFIYGYGIGFLAGFIFTYFM